MEMVASAGKLLFADERGEEILSRLTTVPENALSLVMARPRKSFPIEELQTGVNA